MSQELINHSPDLQKLIDDGYEIEVRNTYALIHHVPYVNSNREIKYGTLISNLHQTGDRTITPDTHVIYFVGEYPCNKDGSNITAIQHADNGDLGNGIVYNYAFSNKPASGYSDYHHKFTTYINIISSPAFSLDNSVTAKTFNTVETSSDSVFNYLDTNSSRAEIGAITQKLENQKIGIVGLGGTGSYILDLVAKTPVSQIHLFDKDEFFQHNAFRAPGAPSKEQLRMKCHKTEYLSNIYQNMHKYIYSHPYYIDEGNVAELLDLDFVFICVDKGGVKKVIIDKLVENGKAFIDVGMGIEVCDNSLIGTVRVTSCTPGHTGHLSKRISFADGKDDAYSTNIQIADLNVLNASLAVIKWKKLCGFYQDLSRDYNSAYSINDGELFNEDK